jgi:hypothetical protein
MAMTDYSIDIVTPPIQGDWLCSSQYCADIDDAFDLVTAVTGSCIYVRKIQLSCGTVGAWFTLGADVAANALVHTYLGPVYFGIASGMYTINFGDMAMKCPVSHSFAIDGANACPVWVYFEYKTIVA